MRVRVEVEHRAARARARAREERLDGARADDDDVVGVLEVHFCGRGVGDLRAGGEPEELGVPDEPDGKPFACGR